MDFMEAVKTCLSKYFDFKGRARRSEYWWFYLFTIIGSIITGIIDTIIFGVESAVNGCLLYTSPSPRDGLLSRMPSSA